MHSINQINTAIPECTRCPRLINWCQAQAAAPPKRFQGQAYWGKPVPGFGDSNAWLMVVGLAPAAHGANRTGRMFTGDRSGDWLYRALHKAGLANQPDSTDRDDGLLLKGAYISAVARCAPPQNKLQRDEIQACQPFLAADIKALDKMQVVLALGSLAFQEFWKVYWSLYTPPGDKPPSRPAFGHGVQIRLTGTRPLWLIGSYHPSQQNTFTKRLTEPMFDSVFEAAWSLAT